MDYLLPASIFLVCLFVIEVVYHSVSRVRDPESRRVKNRLKTLRYAGSDGGAVDILRKDRLAEAPWLRVFPGVKRLVGLIGQANAGISAPMAVVIILWAAIGGYALGLFLSNNPAAPFALGLLCGYLPLLVLQVRKKQRLEKFERQLPDALELIARSLRAGHAFSGGLKSVADEFDDPLGMEFQRVLDEINFGLSVPDALKNLAIRVNCPDLRYFVVSVLIQRDTGGNLAEIIDNMGGIIRERFKFHGKVKVLTAEGRISAVIISVLPFVVAAAIYFLNPKFLLVLQEDPIGRAMVGIGLFLMACGILVLRRMVQVRV